MRTSEISVQVFLVLWVSGRQQRAASILTRRTQTWSLVNESMAGERCPVPASIGPHDQVNGCVVDRFVCLVEQPELSENFQLDQHAALVGGRYILDCGQQMRQ